MNQIIAKIKQTPTAQRCPLAAEIFPILEAELAKIEQLSETQGLKQDFPTTNLQIDLLESTTDELIIKLTGLDAPTSHLWLLSGLNKPDFLKLNKHLKEITAAYPETTATALEIDPNLKKAPPIQEVLEALVALGPEKLRGILEFTKPTLLIVPNNSFESKIAAMDTHKKFKNQGLVRIYTAPNGPFQTVTSPAKPTIAIVDGTTHSPHIPGISSSSNYAERKRLLKKHFAGKHMRLINVHEYAVLMQLSLRDNQKNGKNGYESAYDFTVVDKIVDHCNDDYFEYETITILDDEYLTDSVNVATANFFAFSRQIAFGASIPEATYDSARGRASVQLLEF